MVKREDVYQSIYNVLNGNIGSYNSSSQPTVTASFIKNKDVFPQIVISDPNKTNSTYTFKGGIPSNREISIVITIITNTTKQNSSANKDRTILCDDVETLINNNIPDGLHLKSLGESDDNLSTGGNNLKIKTLSFVFGTR